MNAHPEMSEIHPEIRAAIVMPPEIAKAIVHVMAKITPLSKDGENKFQRYSYVSVDQFFEAVGRLMAEADIFVVAFERSMDIAKRSVADERGQIKESMWLSACYDLYIYHASGAQFGPVARSIQVPASGAQSYASAMSYVEKYFLRSLFKIPTGDGDADSDDRRTFPMERGAQSNGRHAPAPPPPPSTNTAPSIDWLKFKLALSAAESDDEITMRYDQLVTKYRPGPMDRTEAQALVAEARADLMAREGNE